ncbi:GABA transporter 1-like isoform X1 [Senna tora]|uniref:GABA transporter 1-like isoform X1 n=1 Tax=Senna tora TaxID=362788 RepID=A0A834W599_9FABA|nr:GABA transporter 1-like isoform X1 [Senna tora]
MPFFGDFVSICGAIGFTPLDFVFPALAYLKAGTVLGCIGAIRFIVEDVKTYKFFHDM